MVQKICNLDKALVVGAINDGIADWFTANGSPQPQTIAAEIVGYIPSGNGQPGTQGSQQSIFGYATYDAATYGAVPNIGPVAGHNPQCDGEGNTIGTLVIDPNLPANATGPFDLEYTFIDNSGGGGAMFVFCPSTGERGPLVSAGGSFGNNTGPITTVRTLDPSVLSCPPDEVLVGINAWGVSGDYPEPPRCDHLSAEVGALITTTPTKRDAARACFAELFCGFNPEDLVYIDDCPDGVEPPSEIKACTRMLAFDYDRGLLQAGETSAFAIMDNGTLVTTVVHDYTTTYDGTNVSTYYDPIVAAINALPNWTMTLVTDVAAPAQGKPLWQIEYTGTGAGELKITKNGGDTHIIRVDANGGLTTAVTEGGGAEMPDFNSPTYEACP